MKLLRKYEEKLSELQTQQRIVEREIAWVKELIDNLKKEASRAPKPAVAEMKQEPVSEELKGKETAEAAEYVLRKVFPNDLHQKEIVAEMFRLGWNSDSRTPDQTVGTALLRRPDKFDKTGRGRFKLRRNGEEDEIPF